MRLAHFQEGPGDSADGVVVERIRVACVNPKCRAHRIARLIAGQLLAGHCRVCGFVGFIVVQPSPSDLLAIYGQIVAAAEAIDLALHSSGGVTKQHPAAPPLREACRRLALARAGCLVAS